MDIVKNDRDLGGTWAKVRLEAWVRIDESTVHQSAAAMLNPTFAELIFKGTEPAETLVIDGVMFFVDTTFMSGQTPDADGVWSYCSECGAGPIVVPKGQTPTNCERCGSNLRTGVQ